VNQAIKTGAIPSGWNDECQKLYDEKIKENRLRDERIKKMQDDMKRESEQRNEKANERYSRKEEIDELIKNITTSVSKRAEFKERIRISHEGQNDQFIDALMDYLNELADDSRRIEACYNIIKVCKGIANDLQVKA
jgi:polyhydroxyalkanoate synthesis regulator phasin